MWRLLGFFLNPFAAILVFLFSRIGRKVDSWLSPAVGMAVAVLVALWALSVSGLALTAVKDELGRAVGLVEPPAVRQVDGVVQWIRSETPQPKSKVRQELTVSYQLDGRELSFRPGVTVSRSKAHQVGERLPVYVVAGEGPRLRAPNDRGLDAVISVLAVGLSLIVLYWAWRYLAHRRRIYAAARRARPVPMGSAPAPGQPVALRGAARPLSTAERIKADAERARQMGRK